MNPHGQAAKQAYDPHLVLRYIADIERDPGVRRTEHWTDSVTGRTIRRWREAKGITPWALERVLLCYIDLDELDPAHNRLLELEDFEDWAGPAGRIRG